MTEIVPHQQPHSVLAEQMDYARATSTASMLPDQYRGKPADILIAVGLGQSMGLSPAESLYRISVIKGKPTASAELIASNVRKAGHRLRVSGDATSATCTIIRADDPEFPFEVTRDAAWAKSMGLANNDNYKKQMGTMLQWRAITACARLACPEALYGVAYTPDEMTDADAIVEVPSAKSGAARLRQTLNPETVAQSDPEPVTVEAEFEATAPPQPMADKTRAHMFALFTQKGADDRDKQMKAIKAYAGVEPESRSELSEDQAWLVINGLKQLKDVEPAQEPAP